MSGLLRLRSTSIFARRQPRAVLALWVWEATLGLLLGSQVASVAGAAYARHPDGDLPLFAAGGLELLDLLRHSAAAAGPIFSTLVFVALAAHFGGLLPSAAVLAELAFVTRDRRAPGARDALACALAALPAMIAIACLTLAVEATLVLASAALATWVSPAATPRLGEALAGKLCVAIVVAGVVMAGGAGIAGDVARAAVVQRRESAQGALLASLAACARHPGLLSWSYAWRLLASLLPVAMGLAVTARAHRHGALALVTLAVLHQAIVLSRVALRTSWMARTLRSLG